ncbi:phosphopantetheine-binding protein [Micromonospora sp. CPCC 205539]|uniref:phosphopantetheine-binding protein n=1 Tax=Micromonospora sp. CPCC 205539 TaxID=3122408 RepID=UPI002FF319FF
MTTEERRPVRVDAIERVVADAWGAALGVAGLTEQDHFFERGGDSLAAARMAAQLRTALDVRLPLSAVFEHPTLGGFTAALRAEHGMAVDEAAELYLSVLACSEADAESLLGRLDD